MDRVLIALGGNALGNSAEEQKNKIACAARLIAAIAEEGYELIISHGNGPQVGMISAAFADKMPFPECSAMSQGYIGYQLQTALDKELKSKKAVTVVTTVEVDANDSAFLEPTKPIGEFLSEAEMRLAATEHPDYIYKEDAHRGYRRVVPSPKPIDIIEKDAIRALVSGGFTVIACGGGGVPVIRRGAETVGVNAVIDKDYASEKLAELLDADILLILTAVDGAYLHYGRPEQRLIRRAAAAQADKYIAEGHFASGSMLPKVAAAAAFARSRAGRRAIIASLENAPEAVKGKSGTVID